LTVVEGEPGDEDADLSDDVPEMGAEGSDEAVVDAEESKDGEREG